MYQATNPLNVYGSSAEFLDPYSQPPTPLVDVTEELQLFPRSARVRVMVKDLTVPPVYNLKRLTAHNMLRRAMERGALDGIEVIVEASSGNTVKGLGYDAKNFGIRHVVAVVPADLPQSKEAQLNHAGVYVHKHSERPGNTCIDFALRLGKKKGWLCLFQYANQDNPDVHAEVTGPQIWQQTEGLVTVASVGMGTMGTATGLRKFFPEHVHVVGGKLLENNPVPGLREESRLQHHFDRTGLDEVEVGQYDSYELAILLCQRAGFELGPSTGTGMVAGRMVISSALEAGTDHLLRNSKGEILWVAIGCDQASLYFDKFTTVLPSEYFSAPPPPGLFDGENK